MIRCNGGCSERRATRDEELRLAKSLLLHHAGALLRCVREYCGDVETTALAKLAALSSDHAMPIPPGTPGPEGALNMVCVPKLQTALTMPGPAAASDRMADKRMMAKD